MSWLFSQVLVEEYLGENFSDGEQSALSNGNNIPQAYCAPDKMTEFSRLSRFGITFKPLTEIRGEELLTLYLEGFHAKTSQLQEMEMGLTENDQECGEKWHGLLARFDQDSHLWRTVQCSLLEDLNESLQTLPRWGMTVGGALYLLPTLVQNIEENESGLSLIPTPTSSTGGPNHNSPTTISGKRFTMNLAGYAQSTSQVIGQLNPTWVEWLMGWPLGWTDLKPLEMDKFHCVPQQHGES
jgi:hypothetical protein